MQYLSIGKYRLIAAVSVGAFLIAALSSCVGGKEARAYAVYSGGDPHRGAQVISNKKCGSCHVIPGINGAAGMVGPPLNSFARRTYIGGEVANTPQNLVRWLMNPQSIEPHTAMPNLGLTEQQARDVAAFLYTHE
jgi:cytochrome c